MVMSMIQRIINKMKKERGKNREKITILNTADAYIMDRSLPMMDRMRKAINAWTKHNREWEYLLLDQEAFFAAQCWVFTHHYSDPKSDVYDLDIEAYLEKSKQAIGGNDGWWSILGQRIGCHDCGQIWKKENIKYCVRCMHYICMDCQKKHESICKEALVG